MVDSFWGNENIRQMEKVRIGIVGMGNMGRFHAQDLLDGKVEGGELVAVASTSPDKLKEYGEQGLKVFGVCLREKA